MLSLVCGTYVPVDSLFFHFCFFQVLFFFDLSAWGARWGLFLISEGGLRRFFLREPTFALGVIICSSYLVLVVPYLFPTSSAFSY